MNTLTKLFTELVSIPSPSGKEKDVALEMKKCLDSSGIKSFIDNSGKLNDSNCGNIIAEISGKNSKKTLLFVAHMDTVEKGDKKIVPIIKNGIITSDGRTILGADDKGAVACLMEAMFEIKKMPSHPAVYAIFTTREEKGKMGVSCVKKIPGIDYAFNLDGQGPQGTFVYKSLGQLVFKIEIMGEGAHSAINPEKGRNAIAAASHFISRTKQGRKTNALINIGTIKGGRSVNVISDYVEIEAEIRSYSQKNIDLEFEKLKRQLKKSCGLFMCTYKIKVLADASVPVMENTANKKMLEIVKQAAKDLNLPFVLSEGSFTTEANFLSEKGYRVLTVCRGGTNAHSNKESIKVTELESYKKLILGLVKHSTE